ncbi:hypothetical protein AB1Y20_004221 [Prymnesium parvum]|uniref:Glycosyltransferase family 28 N-terminal domain-containing protein n=1 Tax=Prymnesium parvum TaxID=97485 RepID=A0AB34J9M9_PRYPA
MASASRSEASPPLNRPLLTSPHYGHPETGPECEQIWIMGMGSRGDAQPLVALAMGLKRANIDVLVLCNEDHAAFVQAQGVAFESIYDSYKLWSSDPEYEEAMAKGDTAKVLRYVGKFSEANLGKWVVKLDEMLRVRKPRLLLYTYGVMCLAAMAAIRHGVNVLPTNLQVYMTPNADAPPAGMPRLPCKLNGCWARYVLPLVIWNLIAKREGKIIERTLGPGTNPYDTLGFNDFKMEMRVDPEVKHPYLIGMSPLVRKYYPTTGLPRQMLVTGSWIIASKSQVGASDFGGKETMNQLERFLAKGPAVYIGWGSMLCQSDSFMSAMAVGAVKHARVRAIILAGSRSGGLSLEALKEDAAAIEKGLVAYAEEHVLFVRAAPHEWLFPQCSCIVHHGGAGTTAASLRSGSPTIVTPIFGDQPENGAWVSSLGLFGDRPLRELSAEELGEMIIRATTDAGIKAKAEAIRAEMIQEDGVGAAVKFLKEHLELVRKDPLAPAARGLHMSGKSVKSGKS